MPTDTLNGHAPANGRLSEAIARLSPGSAPPVAPFVPDDAPFTDGQRHWLNGLLAGLTVIARSANHPRAAAGLDASAPAVTVLYGSQSGNGEALSKDLRKHASAAGFKPKVQELNDVTLDELAELERVLIICSTFGEGDPPDNAVKFVESLQADDAPSMQGLSYAVCGLGDSSYTFFNKSGRDIDERLDLLGATRVADFVACDVAYEDDYAAWKSAVFAAEAFRGEATPGASPPTTADDEEPAERWSKNEPFPAMVLKVDRLSAVDSAKEVNHVEIALAGSGLDYAVGDALGVWPVNCGELVEEVLDTLGWSGNEVVTLKDGLLPIRAALLSRLDVCTITATTLTALDVATAPEDTCDLHLIDVIDRYTPALEPQQLADVLRPLQPRLYSIASSPLAHPGEVHLTVGAVRYEQHGRTRKGVASTFLADRCGCGASVRVYLQRSAHFHLPPDDVPLIMVGPGTGIAPFRAFLEERSARQAPGRNWLFFGDQHAADDFLYRDQLLGYQDAGLLNRFDTAWSRDQAEKVYVQHRMREFGGELFRWLEDGAAVYVCGDASRMAKDVDAAMHDVISEHGGLSRDAAAEYIDNLKQTHRYQRDVY